MSLSLRRLSSSGHATQHLLRRQRKNAFLEAAARILSLQEARVAYSLRILSAIVLIATSQAGVPCGGRNRLKSCMKKKIYKNSSIPCSAMLSTNNIAVSSTSNAERTIHFMMSDN
jgi:hypothetical protein